MVLTKELAAKGTAILGSAGAGGTGLYYGGNYLNGLTNNAQGLKNYVEAKRDNYVKFVVKKGEEDAESAMQDNGSITGFDVSFKEGNPFVVTATATKLKNTQVSNNHGGTTNVEASSALTCSFKFELEGNTNGTTTIKDNY